MRENEKRKEKLTSLFSPSLFLPQVGGDWKDKCKVRLKEMVKSGELEKAGAYVQVEWPAGMGPSAASAEEEGLSSRGNTTEEGSTEVEQQQESGEFESDSDEDLEEAEAEGSEEEEAAAEPGSEEAASEEAEMEPHDEGEQAKEEMAEEEMEEEEAAPAAKAATVHKRAVSKPKTKAKAPAKSRASRAKAAPAVKKGAAAKKTAAKSEFYCFWRFFPLSLFLSSLLRLTHHLSHPHFFLPSEAPAKKTAAPSKTAAKSAEFCFFFISKCFFSFRSFFSKVFSLTHTSFLFFFHHLSPLSIPRARSGAQTSCREGSPEGQGTCQAPRQGRSSLKIVFVFLFQML